MCAVHRDLETTTMKNLYDIIYIDDLSSNTKNNTINTMYRFVCECVKKSPSNLDGRKRIPALYTLYHEGGMVFSFRFVRTISIDCFG